ncbi:MAG: MFS transporter [Clostridia bacterium]|nr:MFS transporter [Clostridia bacterium]
MLEGYDIYKTSRASYIVEAALEYFISLLITDAFLATLLTKSGISDATAGVITQLASLSFAAQLFAVFIKKGRGIKRFVTLMHLFDQMLYVLLYLVPVIKIPTEFKAMLFVILFLGGHLVASMISPYKLTWLMSLVPDKSRGRFTANKEIISLIGGMIFSFLMGSLVDHFNEIGKENIGFALCGVTIFVLAVLHLVSLLIIKEPPFEELPNRHVGFVDAIKSVIGNKVLLKIILIGVIYHLATGICLSFYGTYKIHELGFSLKYVAFLSMLSAISRVAFSRLFGKFADKYSWAKMMTVCFGILMIAFGVNIFTVPSNGHIMFALYSCLYAISMAGINSGLMNIVFDYVPLNERTAALGITKAAGGLAAFPMALVGSRILTYIQSSSNMLFGIPVYGQQVLSFIAFAFMMLLVVYMKTVILKLKK